MILWLGTQDVIEIHDRLIERFGGSPGLYKSTLYGAMERPLSGFGEHEMYPGLFDKIGALVHGIVAGHAFVDGNKRTGLQVASMLLEANGYLLKTEGDQSEIVSFFEEIASGQHDPRSIAEWLEENSLEKEQ